MKKNWCKKTGKCCHTFLPI